MKRAQRIIISSILLLMALFAPAAYGTEDFTASTKGAISLCPCSGQGYYLTITNTGTTASTYTLSVNKEIKEWVMITPTSFSLQPNTQTNIPLYFNSPCASRGAVPVTVFISTLSGLTKALSSQVNFASCYGFSITSGQPLEGDAPKSVTVTPSNGTYSSCASSKITIPLLVQNTDSTFQNTYTFTTDSSDTVLSVPQFSLEKGKSGVILLSYSPSQIGEKIVTIEGKTSKGDIAIKKQLTFNTQNCYELALDIPEDSHEMCAGIPEQRLFRVSNRGIFRENITLFIDGAEWASLDLSSFLLSSARRTNRTISFNASPDVFGTYPLTVTASSQKNQGMSAQDIISVKVSSLSECYNSAVEADSATTLRGEEYIPFTITNTGSKESTFFWNLTGAEWAILDATTTHLGPGESYHANIHLVPGNAAEGNYPLMIAVSSEHSSTMKAITVTYKAENPTLKSVKSFLFNFRYLLSLLLVALIILILFRNKIIASYQERKKRKIILEARLVALAKARKARMKALRKSMKAAKKSKEPDSSRLGIGSLILLILAILFGFLLALYPTLTINILTRYGLLIGSVLIIGAILVAFVLLPKRKAARKN